MLVNALTCKTVDWSKAGAIANAFLKEGGNVLKQVWNSLAVFHERCIF